MSLRLRRASNPTVKSVALLGEGIATYDITFFRFAERSHPKYLA